MTVEQKIDILRQACGILREYGYHMLADVLEQRILVIYKENI
jgi:hypothetical protein